MDKSTLDRRAVLRGAGAAGAAVVGGVALASSAQASPQATQHRVAGSWLITHQATGGPPIKAVACFAGGGVLLDFELAPAGPAGAGSWEGHGNGRFTGTFWTSAESGPAQAAVLRVHVMGAAEGDRISGTYRATVYDASTEKPIGTESGRFWGHRIPS
ncbi:MAG TPA: hypothetical protein VFL99_05250 [Segeticoccus sp.]|uniref:hypothetical protein n=1 Tax=Segeticoccus sp. TaxID=2706531 RepID=UPI002D8085C9|nr:hypothetical protein [Segeticoccus sp.]HET8599713.1 hypothetical protein [Segeticoccus sp.]